MRASIEHIIFHDEDTIDVNNCWVVAQVVIRPSTDTEGGDAFNFHITTPDSLKHSIDDGEYRFGKSLLILPDYSRQAAQKAIEKLVSSISGDTWKDIAAKLNCYGDWEFEDYHQA